jgi:hypothetical protein
MSRCGGQEKLDWLRRFLAFENGIASHDTFSRVFSPLDAKSFEACFIDWMERLCPSLRRHAIHIERQEPARLAQRLRCHGASGLGVGQRSRRDAPLSTLSSAQECLAGHSQPRDGPLATRVHERRTQGASQFRIALLAQQPQRHRCCRIQPADPSALDDRERLSLGA